VLTEAQWKTVEAVTGRIIPTDHEPGAIEANCVNFIDKALAHEDAKAKPIYERGLVGLDLVAKEKFAKPFVALAPEQQDDVLAALESGKAEGWPSGAVTAAEFFATIRVHTIVGFLADPKYGGKPRLRRMEGPRLSRRRPPHGRVFARTDDGRGEDQDRLG
jgi:gluconate 2-dehydrogenase gamma chain